MVVKYSLWLKKGLHCFSQLRLPIFLCLILLSCASLTPLNEKQLAISYQEYQSNLKSIKLQDGYRLSYSDQGQGPVIVLLHGLPTSSWMYRHLSHYLVAAGYRVIAPDMLGYGNSDMPDGYDIYSREAQAERLIQLMDTLNIKQWSHVFHDAGGLWTWQLLAMQPERVQALIVLNTIIYQQGFKPPMRFKKSTMARAMASLYCSPASNVLTMRQTLTNGLAVHAINYTTAKGYSKPFYGKNCDAIYYFLSRTKKPDFDFSTTIRSLKQPTMVIWGEQDDFLLADIQVPLLQKDMNIADADIHILQGNKHFIAEESPETIAQLVDSFLIKNKLKLVK